VAQQTISVTKYLKPAGVGDACMLYRRERRRCRRSFQKGTLTDYARRRAPSASLGGHKFFHGLRLIAPRPRLGRTTRC
jgi:hypothetical protein